MDLTMKITIEAHGRTYTAELEDDIGAFNEAVRGLLVAVGYHTDTVDDYFPHWEDYQEGCDCSECREDYPWEEKIKGSFRTVSVSVDELIKRFPELNKEYTIDEPESILGYDE